MNISSYYGPSKRRRVGGYSSKYKSYRTVGPSGPGLMIVPPRRKYPMSVTRAASVIQRSWRSKRARLNRRTGGFLGLETKFADQTLTTIQPVVNTLTQLVIAGGDAIGAVDTGSTPSQREGARTTIKSLYFQLLVHRDAYGSTLGGNSPIPQDLDIWVYLDNQNNLGSGTTLPYSLVNVKYPNRLIETTARFKILHHERVHFEVPPLTTQMATATDTNEAAPTDNTITVATSNRYMTGNSKLVEFSISGPINLQYTTGSTTNETAVLTENCVYCIVLYRNSDNFANTAWNQMNVGGTVRTRFVG